MSRIVELFEQVCNEHSDRTAVVYREGKRVHRRSFAQLQSDVHRMNAYFRSKGVCKGDRILAFATSSYKLCVFMLAALESGASTMYVDIWAKQESLRSVFADYKPDMLLVSDKTKHIRVFFKEINRIKNVINIDRFERFAATDTDTQPVPEDTIGLLTMTTGSTGKPKIALRSHLDLMQQLELININLRAEGHETVLTTSYIYVFANILNGYTTVMPQLNLGRYSASKVNRLLSLFSQEQVSMIITTPDFCMKADNIYPKLAKLYFGGAILNLHEAEYIRNKFSGCNCEIIYGSTECSLIASILLDEFIDNLRGSRRSALGRLVNGVRVRLSDEGEILVASEAMLERYLVIDPSTKETDADGILWHHTNDIAQEENGLLYFLGKSRRFVEINGERIYSNCIEQRLISNFPDIPKCAVLMHNNRITVAIQRGNYSCTTAEISRFLGTIGIKNADTRYIKKIPCDVKHHTKINYDKLKEQLS